MGYDDVVVYVEDKAGDQGAANSPAPWWVSPDVDIPSHSGEAVQGTNQVRVRVHAHDEPFLSDKIVAEVYVGKPSLVMSPTTGTKRIDPGTIIFRTVDVPGTEPVANDAGATLDFPWTPSANSADIDGPGHRCLVLRAFPQNITPPTDPFNVPIEGHEAQHNIEVLTTTQAFMEPGDDGGAGTPHDPRRRDKATGLWWEQLQTMATKRRGKRYVVWAFDPRPSDDLIDRLRKPLKHAGVNGFSETSPGDVTIDAAGAKGHPVDPLTLVNDHKFAKHSGVGGKGLFGVDRLLGAASVELSPNRLAALTVRFDLSSLAPHTAVVLHGAQWNAAGEAEGGMTIVAVAPV
jgi:hypothetical protein